MPETYTEFIKAEQLRKGDVLSPNQQVLSVDPKVKFVYVSTDAVGNGSIKLSRTEKVHVTRERPTAEEQAQAELEGKLYFLDLSEQRAAKDYADAQRRLAEGIEGGDWNVASRMQDLLEAKATHTLWARVRQVHLLCSTFQQAEPITRLEAYAKVLEKVREEVLEFSRWSSRSTSTWHNAVEDVELDAKSRFLRDAKWNVQL